jgi:hypothetical protein
VKENLQVKHLHKARKILEEQSKEDTKNPPLHLKKSSEKRHLQGGHKRKGMKMFSMVIVTHVMDMVTNLLIVDIIQGNMLEAFRTP